MTYPSLNGERSYICPKCSAPLKVVDSRPTVFMGEKTVIRRRCCTVCPHRFTTYEISENNLVKNMDIAEKSVLFAKSILSGKP